MTSAETGAPRSIEVELKYRVRDDVTAERLLAANELGGFHARGSVRASQFEDRYLDTADGALARAGFAARLRQGPGDTIVSVKSTARGKGRGALHRREELEGPADRTTEPHDWPPSAARSLILELCGDAPLVELVTVRQLRHRRELGEGTTVVELSLDEVDIVARGRLVERFTELELELVSGNEARLAALAEVLGSDEALSPSTTSKLEAALAAAKKARKRGRDQEPDAEPEPDGARAAESEPPERTVERAAPVEPAEVHTNGAGQEAPTEAPTEERAEEPREVAREVAGEAPRAAVGTDGTSSGDGAEPESVRLVVGKTPGVLADDPVAEAGRKILRFHFARMVAREAGTREGKDSEELHAMRVATRRMRAAWRIFGDAFRPERTKRYRRRLRAVASRLGAVRDLDVLIQAAEVYRAELPAAEQAALEPLLDAWRMYREDARALLIRELDADGHRRFVDDFRDFVRAEGSGAVAVVPTEPHRVRDTAPSRIWAAYEQVRGYESVLRWADVPTLHDLRIRAKWLRYSLEFVRETLGPEAGPLIERVVALQDHLGLLNDADVASHMARAFLVDRGSRLSDAESAAIGRYLVSREREVVRLHRTVGPTWRGVAGLSFRRALGRTLAAL
jgi:CHAD domain-containing protein